MLFVANAATNEEELGEKPEKCQPEGCNGSDFGENFMDNTFVGEITISNDVIRVGEILTAEAQLYNGGTGVGWAEPRGATE